MSLYPMQILAKLADAVGVDYSLMNNDTMIEAVSDRAAHIIAGLRLENENLKRLLEETEREREEAYAQVDLLSSELQTND